MNPGAIQLHPSPLLHSPTLRKVCARGALRIGYVPAAPWVYRTELGLRGHDAAAVARFAQALEVEPWFVECRAGDLPGFLDARHIDVAVGGLVDCQWPQVRCVRARHVFEDQARGGQPRRVYFPNVWWVGRDDPLWRARVAAFLMAQRVQARLPRGPGDRRRARP